MKFSTSYYPQIVSLIAFIGLLIGFGGKPLAASCGGPGGNRTYNFKGKLQVKKNGVTHPLEGVQISVVRQKSPVKWANMSGHGLTNKNGVFNFHCQFARDRNGAVPGGNKIRFLFRARFRNDDLKIRKGGWFKNNWVKIDKRKGCRRSHKNIPLANDIPKCKNYRFTVNETFDPNSKAGKHAYLFWFYTHLQNEMSNKGVGLLNRPFYTHKITVSYPNKSMIQKKGSFYLMNIHISKDDYDGDNQKGWEDEQVLIHEWMHRWDVGNVKNPHAIPCLDWKGHHVPPNNKHANRCTGWMEGFAEATAQRLTMKLPKISNQYSPPMTRWKLRHPKHHKYNVPIDSLRDAEVTDLGWENYLKLFWTHNEWKHSGGDASWIKDCDPKDVSVFKMLQVIRQSAPLDKTFFPLKNQSQTTFKNFANYMRKQISGFDRTDAKLYRLMGNASLKGKEIRNKVNACQSSGGSTAGHTFVINSSNISGTTGYSVTASKSIKQVKGKLHGQSVSIQANDNIKKKSANGYVAAGSDGYKFSGNVKKLSLENPQNAHLFIDGIKVHTVVVDSNNVSGKTQYNIKASKNIEQVNGSLYGRSVSIQSNDKVQGSTAKGHVNKGADGYLIFGKISSINVSNPNNAIVYVDGQKKSILLKNLPQRNIESLPQFGN